MVRNCCVLNCGNSWLPNSNLSFHSLPWRDQKRLEIWISLIPAKNRIGRHSKVCSEHFNDSDFNEFNVNRTLKNTAVPRKFECATSTSVSPVTTVNRAHSSTSLPSKLTNETQQENGENSSQLSPTSQKIPLSETTTANHDSNPQQSTIAISKSFKRQNPSPPSPMPLQDIALSSIFNSDSSTTLFLSPAKRQKLHPDVHEFLQEAVSVYVEENARLHRENLQLQNTVSQLESRNSTLEDTNYRLGRRVHILQARLRRREAKLIQLRSVIKTLQREHLSTKELEEELVRRFSDDVLVLFQNQMNNKGKSKGRYRYTDKMKEFASTIYFYSPKAYSLLKKKIGLPDESVLRKMIGQVACSPGFVDGVFKYLQSEQFRSNNLRDVGLIIDGMSIRSGTSVDQKENRPRGGVEYGNVESNLNGQSKNKETKDKQTKGKDAKEMLAIQVVSYSIKFKIPIAHFFINGTSAEDQAKLLNEAIRRLYNVGLIVHSITADGTKTNISTFQTLGCDLELRNGKKPAPYFKHPLTSSNVYAIMDPCHMLKLVRNIFASKDITSSDGLISFKYVRELHKLQEDLGLKYANKLNETHVRHENKKMKVCLAAQTISNSVADAIDYLRSIGHELFQGSEATTRFIRVFDRLFDMMNSRNAFGTGFKSPLTLRNKDHWMKVFDESEKYIRELKIDDTDLTLTASKTFALGFLIDIYSFRGLAIDLLTNISQPLKYFLTYKVSQDHIELYFCCIRSRGGWNNNPTTLQALWAIRRLLFRNSVQPSANGNCSPEDFESNPIFKFRSKHRDLSELTEAEELIMGPNETLTEERENEEMNEIVKLMEALEMVELRPYHDAIIAYIAGSIVAKFIKKCECSHCHDLISTFVHTEHKYSKPDVNDYLSFIKFINRGKLCMPSPGIFEMMKFCEKVFRAQVDIIGDTDINFKERMCTAALREFVPKIGKIFPKTHPIVETIDKFTELHEVRIIKHFAAAYAKIRLHAYAKAKTLKDYSAAKTTLRQKYSRLIIFNNV